MRKKIYVVVLLSLMLLGSSCNIEDKDAPINEYGNIDLNKVPYNKLSDYRFFTGAMNELNPAQGVYPYDLTASLFSDYAAKERLIYLPEGTTMEYQGDFKVLEFSKENKKILLSHTETFKQAEKKAKKTAAKTAKKAVKKIQETQQKSTLADLEVLSDLKDDIDKKEEEKDSDDE